MHIVIFCKYYVIIVILYHAIRVFMNIIKTPHKPLVLAVSMLFTQFAIADDGEPTTDLGTLTVTATPSTGIGNLLGQRGISDQTIKKEALKQRSATLGNALAGERGIHSNPFGGGASAPVIRGQEGVRVKILQNGTDVVDMSSVSPDHAVAADSLLADKIEVVRGASTLLYATASQAGVVNVADKRIPNSFPKNGKESELFLRYNANSKERLATAGTTLGLGKQFALRLEGLARHADLYGVPDLVINQGEAPVKRLPDSYNHSKVGTVGLSWIGTQGYLGASFSRRQDKYGLVGHNHEFDHCAPDILATESLDYPKYVTFYPHLMTDNLVSRGLHSMHCGNDHANDPKHSHDNIYGHKHDHTGPGPWVDLISKRYDLRGEWRQPMRGVDKIRLASTYSNYHHDERGDGKAHLSELEKKQIAQGLIYSNVKQRLGSAQFYKDNPESVYDNKGLNTRLDIVHSTLGDINTIGELKGSWGVQYQTQKSSVKRPFVQVKISDDITHIYGERQDTGRTPLIDNTNKQLSFFGVEQYRYKNLTLETGVRGETQTVDIDYDPELLARAKAIDGKYPSAKEIAPHKQRALSYLAGLSWDFKPDYRLSVVGSHNERLPTPMELYYHGKHLATNSYQYGNRELNKEQSNNFEVGFKHTTDKWDYKVSAYYNKFKNYINNENLYREGNLFQRRYTQYPAKIYGIEAELGYYLNDNHKITLYGDYVRGKLYHLPKIYGTMLYSVGFDCKDEFGDDEQCPLGLETVNRPDRNAPRMPPARLGLTLSNNWNDRWSSSLDLMHVFNQKHTSTAIWVKEKSKEELEDLPSDQPKLKTYQIPEDPTKGYTMLNLGVNYHNTRGNLDYTVSLNANNLLNQKVYIHNSYLPYVPQMGRNVSVGLTLKY